MNMDVAKKQLLTTILLTALSSHVSADAEYFSYYNGKQYRFKITETQLAHSPKWNKEKNSDPPYPAAKALERANKFIASIPAWENTYWYLEDLAVVEVMSNGWVWRARYRLTPFNGITTGVWPMIDCWVLMDGTLVEPDITEDKML